jgi:pilus assembly protein CpaF
MNMQPPLSAGALVVTVTTSEGETTEIWIDTPQVLIGTGRDCAVVLSGWLIAAEHARILRTPQGLVLEDTSQLRGTRVNGTRVLRHGPLTYADKIEIGGYKLRIQEVQPRHVDKIATADAQATPVTGRVPPTAQLFQMPPKPQQASPSLKVNTEPEAKQNLMTPSQAAEVLRIQARHPWRKRVHDQLLETIDLRRRDLTRMSDAELRVETERLVREILENLADLPNTVDRGALTQEVLNEAIGLGPLEELLADDSVTEIMVNRADEIFIERGGKLQWYPLAFTSDRAVLGVIERIVAPLGRRIDESSPLVDARLKDGSRVNAIIPPLALKGPSLTIRKFSKKRLGSGDMVGFGSVSEEMVLFLELCVKHRKNMIVSGGTGSGKTTFLNLLSNFIPEAERIITIEDAAELKLNHANLVSLEARPSNVEGRGAITIRDLVKNALRMRPDRIVVGECRGGEALDMLQAMNTGHEGSMTTLHANTPRDALARLETLILMAGMDLPINAIREQIASAVDVVVQQTRFSCGARKVTSITEITGMENGRIQLQELFRFEHKGYLRSNSDNHGDSGKTIGHFSGCDAIPSFYDELRQQGAQVDLKLFDKHTS